MIQTRNEVAKREEESKRQMNNRRECRLAILTSIKEQLVENVLRTFRSTVREYRRNKTASLRSTPVPVPEKKFLKLNRKPNLLAALKEALGENFNKVISIISDVKKTNPACRNPKREIFKAIRAELGQQVARTIRQAIR